MFNKAELRLKQLHVVGYILDSSKYSKKKGTMLILW